jgi:anti-sigma factor RsiW
MNCRVESITEIDLQAYVDNELAPDRRMEVHAYLRCHEAEAAQIMSDLRTRDLLRLALSESSLPPSGATVDAALRLERGLWRGRIVQRARRIAAVAVLVGFGWLAHAEVGQLGIGQVAATALPPAYVTDAVKAHRATLLRASMHSLRGAAAYDPAEIRSTTAIVLPTLPQDWQVADVQIFPSTFGPSVEMAIRTEAFGTGSLFAVRPGKFDVVPPTLANKDDFIIAYWQVGEVAYALVAKAEPKDLSEVAAGLATSLY